MASRSIAVVARRQRVIPPTTKLRVVVASPIQSLRQASTNSKADTGKENVKVEGDELKVTKSLNSEQAKKTMAELDEELRLKMEGLAGDGGEAGVELEDGQPTAMKRSVRSNMFRYI